MAYQNMWNRVKIKFTWDFIALNAYISKETSKI